MLIQVKLRTITTHGTVQLYLCQLIGYNVTMHGLLFKTLLGLTGFLSLPRAHRWATRVGGWVWRWSEKQRRITRTNIALCFPQLDTQSQEQLAKSALNETIKTFFELGHVWKKHGSHISPLIQHVHGQTVLENALKENCGVLLAAPHFGNWEVLNLWLARYQPFSFLYKPPENPAIERALFHYRGQSGGQQIKADKKGVRQVLNALKGNHLMAILPDQQPKSGQGLFAPFMGQSAYTMTLFSKVAIKTQVPVLMAVAERLEDGQGFDIHFKRLDPAIHQDLETSVTTLNQAIEDMIKINPAQYQWTYRRFSIQADGSKPYRQPE